MVRALAEEGGVGDEPPEREAAPLIAHDGGGEDADEGGVGREEDDAAGHGEDAERVRGERGREHREDEEDVQIPAETVRSEEERGESTGHHREDGGHRKEGRGTNARVCGRTGMAYIQLEGAASRDMVLTRRRILHLAGAATAALAGCGATPFESGESARAYTLDVEPIAASPVDNALYEPSDDPLFGLPARETLAAILPDGRHTTAGYRPVPEGAYVEHEGSYYRTAVVITGRTPRRRTLVRVDPVPKADVPANATRLDSLDRPSARVLKILHSDEQTGGEGSSAELLSGDAYVLRRPAERESELAAGELTGSVVTMTDSGAWSYRVDVTRERVEETAYTTVAVPVADSRDAFREVVFASRIDAELGPGDLPAAERERLAAAIESGDYRETEPLSAAFASLLDRLGVRDVEGAVTGRRLWYDGEYYRYAVYVADA